MNIFFQTGRTLIRMNEIKLEKMGIANPNHRLFSLSFNFICYWYFLKISLFFLRYQFIYGLVVFQKGTYAAYTEAEIKT